CRSCSGRAAGSRVYPASDSEAIAPRHSSLLRQHRPVQLFQIPDDDIGPKLPGIEDPPWVPSHPGCLEAVRLRSDDVERVTGDQPSLLAGCSRPFYEVIHGGIGFEGPDAVDAQDRFKEPVDARMLEQSPD